MADECLNNGWCSAVLVRLDRMEKAQDETRDTLREVAAAINKLAVIEERQAAASTAIERLVQSLERLDERLRHLEVAEPMQTVFKRMHAAGKSIEEVIEATMMPPEFVRSVLEA